MKAAQTASAPTERKPRTLSLSEVRVRRWVKGNHGVLSRIARELDLSIQYVSKIAYYENEMRSKDFRVERKLKHAGCPLMQRVG